MMVVPPAIAIATIVETNQIFVNYICVEIGKLKKLPHSNRSVTTIVETRYILYVKFPTHVVDEYLDEELSVRHIHRILFPGGEVKRFSITTASSFASAPKQTTTEKIPRFFFRTFLNPLQNTSSLKALTEKNDVGKDENLVLRKIVKRMNANRYVKIW